MKLIHLLQAYSIDELIPVINDMFPGTAKFRPQFQQAYNLLMDMKPVASKKVISYKLIKIPKSDESYVGAADSCFKGPWEVTLGMEVVREKGASLDDAELAANCLVNLCLLGRYPKEFEAAHQALAKG